MTAFGTHVRFTASAQSSSPAHCKRHALRHTSAGRADSTTLGSRLHITTRPTPACRAEERSRDSVQTRQTEKLEVPDTPPAKDSSSRTSDEASTSQQQDTGISDELKALQQRKRESQAAAPSNYFQSILQEVRLIEWPSPKQALTNTVLVIAIVGASSVVLFAINSTLAELSKISYR